MSTSPGEEIPASPADRINNALVMFTGCIGSAFDDICSYGLTIGDTYVPFDPDPEDECALEEALCSQVWVRVDSIQPAPGGLDGWGGDCAVSLRAELEVGVIRCVDIPEDGEAPTATDVLVASMQAMEDMNRVFCAAMSCEVWDSIMVGSWQPTGPLGGQYGGIWTFTVDL